MVQVTDPRDISLYGVMRNHLPRQGVPLQAPLETHLQVDCLSNISGSRNRKINAYHEHRGEYIADSPAEVFRIESWLAESNVSGEVICCASEVRSVDR